MNAQQAEADIQQAVKNIDVIRANASLTDDEKEVKIAEVDAEITELKKVTGPRHITGTSNIGGHS